MIDHRRDDLVELPSDCEPPPRICPTCGQTDASCQCWVSASHPCSYYLRLPCRTLAQAVRDVSRVRDLPDWVWELLYARPSNVISMAEARRARRR
jgi:hypothetical protein